MSRTASTVTSRPSRMMPTRSQIRSTSSSSCEERNTVAPRSRSSATTVRNSSCISGSNPLVGSSRITSSGWWKSAWISPIFWRFPRESSRSGRDRSASKRSASACALPRPSIPRSAANSRSSSRPVMPSSYEKSPGRLPTRARIARLSRRLSSPNSRALPLVGCRRSRSVRIVVVFPAPLGPRKPKISPAATVRQSVFDAARPSVALGQAVGLDHRGHLLQRRVRRGRVHPQAPAVLERVPRSRAAA